MTRWRCSRLTGANRGSSRSAPRTTGSTLRRCRDAGIGGGAVYDALIAACARKARVATLVTWDVGAFERFLEDEPAVRAPEVR